jgi:hypothetical protein
MTSSLEALPGAWRAVVRRAFADTVGDPHVRYLHSGERTSQPPRALPPRDGGERLALVVPTLVAGGRVGDLPENLHRIDASAARLAEAGVDCFVVVVAHDPSPHARADEALAELQRLQEGTTPWVGVSVSEPSKALALNCSIPVIDANEATAVAWFDDDVHVLPDCLPALWRSFDPLSGAVYGARKSVVPSRTRFSARWAHLKNRREAVNRYPHGCAMLMSRATFGDGIPPIYMTDDHYFLARFLDPSAPDPLRLLRVVEDAVVDVPADDSPRTTLRRIVRNYRNVQRVLADTPAPVVHYFMRELHFAALRRSASLAEALSARYWLRLGFHSGRRLVWEATRAELCLRAVLRRPRPAVWFDARG